MLKLLAAASALLAAYLAQRVRAASAQPRLARLANSSQRVHIVIHRQGHMAMHRGGLGCPAILAQA